MTPCPNCQKPVDPLRARAVGVRDGKVVAYCSTACADAAAGKPAAPAVKPPVVAAGKPTPAGGAKVRAIQDFDSGPVIEILHEPSSGVVTSARDERADSKPVVAAAAEPVKPADKPSEIRTTGTEIDPREILGPDKDDGDDGDDDDDADDDDADEPVALVDKKPVADDAGPRASRRRRDSLDAKMGHDWLDDEPADVRPSTVADEQAEEETRSGKRGVLLTLLLLALLAGGGFAIYKFVYLPRVSASAHDTLNQTTPGSVVGEVAAPQPPPPQGSAVEAPPEPVSDNRISLDRAIGVLKQQLVVTGSLRVQRQAAAALARTADTAAIERLIAGIDKDKLEDAGRLDVAHALARAGNKRGTDTLVAALRSERRDTRLGAARLLAQVADRSGVAVLVGFLEVPQHRLGAAEVLAVFAEPKAIAVLEQVRADAKATADDKARATIALVVAGKPEHVPAVRALLADPRFNSFAADALAGHRDEAARPVLEKQLAFTQLRVDAARSLRRLAPDRDVGPYLLTLLDALDDARQQKDIDQIATAEAVLLLAGPASWSERR